MVIERQKALQHAMAKNLVHDIMTADVLADDDEFTLAIADGGGVETAGFGEGVLGLAEMFRGAEQGLRGDLESALDLGKMALHGLDGGLATEAAAGRGVDMPGQLGEVDLHLGSEKDLQHVPGAGSGMRLNLEDVRRALDQALGEEETGGQFRIVPRRAHRDHDGTGLDLNLQRLLDGQLVEGAEERLAPPPAMDAAAGGNRRGRRRSRARHG